MSDSKIRKLLDSTVSGAAYGFSAVAVSHPFDTIKTKLQAESQFAGMRIGPAFWKVIRTQGIIGLYRGFAAATTGSVAFRALPFTAYTFTSSQLERYTFWKRSPFLLACVAGSSGGLLRSLVECPLEVAKVRRQVGVKWQWASAFQGLPITVGRNMSVIGLFFGFVQASIPVREVFHVLIFFLIFD